MEGIGYIWKYVMATVDDTATVRQETRTAKNEASMQHLKGLQRLLLKNHEKFITTYTFKYIIEHYVC